MLRVYLDNNIFQIIKESHYFYNHELRKAIDGLKDKILFCFSDAHLDDLKDSIKEYRDFDLEFIGEYVKDNYFTRNIYLEFQCSLATPTEAFDSKDYKAADLGMSNMSKLLDSFLDSTDDIPEILGLKGQLKAFFNRPISDFLSSDPFENINEDNDKWLKAAHPTFSTGMSIRDFFESNIQFSNRLNIDKREYASLRKHISKYLNRDDYSWDNWKMEFNEKMKFTNVGKTFLDVIDSMLLDSQKEDAFKKISYAYYLLEMYGVTQERTNKGLKKFALNSLTKDASHTYYASFADYLVTDDRGMQVKAHIVYELFNLSTKVLSVKDFVNINHQIINNEETIDSFQKSLIYDINHAFKMFSKQDLLNYKTIDTYKTYHTYFNYFNRLQVVTEERDTTYVMYCKRNSHADMFYMYREIELISSKLFNLFGTDDDMKGSYTIAEEGGQLYLRKWTRDKLCFELLTTSNVNGVHICLIFRNK